MDRRGLTGVVRHASRATRVEVHVTGHDDSVRLTVRDDGDPVSPGPDRSSAYGLVGMRERAALLGGVLETGPAADGGWTVTAELPRDGKAR